jgi:hypothetical protein
LLYYLEAEEHQLQRLISPWLLAEVLVHTAELVEAVDSGQQVLMQFLRTRPTQSLLVVAVLDLLVEM